MKQKQRICKNCTHRFQHEFTNRLFYCKVKYQKGTAYGQKKVKAYDACELYEELKKSS